MTIKVGSVYEVTVKSGNTASAFSWPSKIPDSGNKYMKNKVIIITKKLNPKDSLEYDYVGDIYDIIDGAPELNNIKIVSKQLILKSSNYPVPGRKKSSGKGKKSKKITKKSRKSRKSRKRSSRKTRRSYIKKTRKRKMRGGAQLEYYDREKKILEHRISNYEKTIRSLRKSQADPINTERVDELADAIQAYQEYLRADETELNQLERQRGKPAEAAASAAAFAAEGRVEYGG